MAVAMSDDALLNRKAERAEFTLNRSRRWGVG
jgi:hypothetical protein